MRSITFANKLSSGLSHFQKHVNHHSQSHLQSFMQSGNVFQRTYLSTLNALKSQAELSERLRRKKQMSKLVKLQSNPTNDYRKSGEKKSNFRSSRENTKKDDQIDERPSYRLINKSEKSLEEKAESFDHYHDATSQENELKRLEKEHFRNVGYKLYQLKIQFISIFF